MSEKQENVLYASIDSTAIITLNRPSQRNAVNAALTRELRGAVGRFQNDPAVRVVVLTGAGDKAFCAGMDLKAFARGEGPEVIEGPGGFGGFTSCERTKPVICALNGHALGGGAEIMLACDLVVAADTALIGFPEVRHGLFPGAGGVIRLPRTLSKARATELLLTGEPVASREALEFGLVNRVVAPDKVMDTALDLAARIGCNGPLAVRETLALIRSFYDGGSDMAERNAEAWTRVSGSEDAAEGVRAFAEKRSPVWRDA